MSTLANESPIRCEILGDVGLIVLARPERLNALNGEAMSQLHAAFLRMGDSSDVRAVVLSGEGRAFSAGLDLEAGLDDTTLDDAVEGREAGMRKGAAVIIAMRTIPQPVIAAVRGHAIGAGFALAVAADVRFIAADTAFSAPFLKLGMSAGDLGLSWFLPRMLGYGRAAELFYSAGAIRAAEAVELGLASGISDDPLADAVAFASALAAFPPYGVHASKSLMNASGTSSLRDHLDSEFRAQVIGSLTLRARDAMSGTLRRTEPHAD